VNMPRAEHAPAERSDASPLLAISGEQGSAKTVLSKRALPREVRELMIAANNGYLRMTIFDSTTVFSGNSAHFTRGTT
jgi:hypothetical protein